VKVLTDAQTSSIFVDMLRGLGWDVETVHQHGLSNEKHDERLVAFARRRGCIFISFDKFGAAVAVDVAKEIYEHGGKVIRIGGGPQQPPTRALGRLLFHMDEWQPFLEQNDGLVILSDLKNPCKKHARAEIRDIIRRSDQPLFDEYLRSLEERRNRPRPRRRRATRPGQSDLPLSDGA
jgi:hypothetical protein